MNYKELLKEIVSVMNEELFYKSPSGEEGAPIQAPIEKIAQDILKYIKRKFPELRDIDLEYKKGKRVLHFTNFGNLSQRDEIIRELEQDGWLSDPQVKRSMKYHRAITPFVDKTPSGKEYPIVIQLNQGGGAAKAGDDYEDEIAQIINEKAASQGKSYEAKKEGGSTSAPDVVVQKINFQTGEAEDHVSFEAKTKIGADFGQFQIIHDPTRAQFAQRFKQKTQTDSPTLSRLFQSIKAVLNKSCRVPTGNVSGELLKIGRRGLGRLVEEYYAEKNVDYIIVNDQTYSLNETAATQSGLKRFKDSAKEGYIRVRRKCHGKSYSTTVAIRFNSVRPSKKYYEDIVFDKIFP
tara:strand:+ start:5623 stop:6669 length:1047 start_codon:yes stop_codon:yes gene_type:complete